MEWIVSKETITLLQLLIKNVKLHPVVMFNPAHNLGNMSSLKRSTYVRFIMTS